MVKDGTYALGGQHAILIQWLHPGLARGSIEHSDFVTRSLHRLKTTSRFLNTAVYGTPEEKAGIFSVIHKKHSTVKGEDYFANDPELHKWTVTTLFMSLIVVHEAFFGKLSTEKKEALFKESSIYATSLQMPTEMWPATLDEFWKYWNRNTSTLPITQWAKDLAHSLLYPKNTPLWSAAGSEVADGAITAGKVEDGVRLLSTEARKGAYKVVKVYVGIVYQLMP
jgi:uncharacterized protein (DUF2236 family)